MSYPGFFEDLYGNLKQTLGMVVGVWCSAFDKDIIEGSLKISHEKWLGSLSHLSNFFKAHNLKN